MEVAGLAVVVAACGCTAVGCAGSVGFSADALSSWVGSDIYALEVCIETECFHTRVTPDSTPSDTVWVETSQNDETPAVARVVVTASAGDAIVQASGDVTFDLDYPNGRFCGPVCGAAEVEIIGNEVRNAS